MLSRILPTRWYLKELLLLAVGFFYRGIRMAFPVAWLDVLTRFRATILAPVGGRFLTHIKLFGYSFPRKECRSGRFSYCDLDLSFGELYLRPLISLIQPGSLNQITYQRNRVVCLKPRTKRDFTAKISANCRIFTTI